MAYIAAALFQITLLQSVLAQIIAPVLGILVLFIFAEVIFSWLIAFNIVNLRNPVMGQIYNIIRTIVTPILEPFRKIIPPIGGLDLSPIAALLLLSWLQSIISYGGPIFNMLG